MGLVYGQLLSNPSIFSWMVSMYFDLGRKKTCAVNLNQIHYDSHTFTCFFTKKSLHEKSQLDIIKKSTQFPGILVDKKS
jgi:hypothetical protein